MASKREPATEPSSRPELSDELLRAHVKMYEDCGGNKSEAARRLGLPRMTYSDRLKEAEKRFGIVLGRIADGRIEPIQHEERSLPPEGHIHRYIFTSAQNNTHLHPGWLNLKAYADWLNDLDHASCEFIVGTFSYALDAYGTKSVKRGSWKSQDDMWYAPEILEHIRDERIELAPGLVWCGEMNILPTTRHPLSGLETYNGRKSNIIPHAKIEMDSVPSMPGEGVKFNWSTGTVTQRNYIQKGAGIKAEQWHSYGGLLVEVDHLGNWWVRQLHIDGNGAICDVGPSPYGGILIRDGEVHSHSPIVEAIVWGDIHVSEMEPWVRALGWGAGPQALWSAQTSMLDALVPRRQVLHDIYSHRSRSHHEMKDFHAMYGKMVDGLDSVEAEVAECAKFLTEAHRNWCEMVVVPSNHDRHLTRWLNEEDPRRDPKNAKYYMRLQAQMLDAIERRDPTFNILEWALRQEGIPDDIRFLTEDESYVICRDVDGGIECGLHGDRGPGGSRGSTRGLTRLGRSVIKGHDHTAAIRDNVYSVGACQLQFPYMRGPSAHSVSHVVTFVNGRRQVITMWEGRWRA